MIELRAAADWIVDGPLVLAPTNERFETGARIGILAGSSSGKTSLARLLAGIVPPKSGRIKLRFGRSSIIGQENLLHPYMRPKAATETAASFLQLPYGAAPKAMRFADLQDYDRRISEFSPVEKSRLAFAISVQQCHRWVIADDRLIPNDPGFAPYAQAAITRRLHHSGLIYISKNATQLMQYCDRYFAFAGGNLIPVADLTLARSLIERSERKAA